MSGFDLRANCASAKGLLILAAVLAAGCATPLRSGSSCVVDAGYFAERLKYTWQNDPAVAVQDDTGFVSPMTVARVRSKVVEELRNKGFELAGTGQQEEFLVAVSLNIRRELQSIDRPSELCDGLPCWERVGMDSGSQFNVVTIGFLAVDVFADGEPVWRGWAEKYLYPNDRDDYGDIVDAAVGVVFKDFPP